MGPAQRPASRSACWRVEVMVRTSTGSPTPRQAHGASLRRSSQDSYLRYGSCETKVHSLDPIPARSHRAEPQSDPETIPAGSAGPASTCEVSGMRTPGRSCGLRSRARPDGRPSSGPRTRRLIRVIVRTLNVTTEGRSMRMATSPWQFRYRTYWRAESTGQTVGGGGRVLLQRLRRQPDGGLELGIAA